MSEQAIDKLSSVFREVPNVQFKQTHARRTEVKLRADTLPAILALLKGRSYIHLSAISCIDRPEFDEFELVYHIWSHEEKNLISAHIKIPKKPGEFVSVHDIYTPAAYFERDIHEMFGVKFEGAPNLKPFVLTEWQGPPPMLKSFDTEKYVQDTYDWLDYQPQWWKEVQEKGGGYAPEDRRAVIMED